MTMTTVFDGLSVGSLNCQAKLPSPHFLNRLTLYALDNTLDILCLQEVDFRAERTLDINQLEYLAKGLDLPYTAYVVVWNKNYLPWPYWPPTAHYGRIVSGQAILSRFPIKSQDIFYFKKPSANAFWYNWFYPDKVVQKVTIQWGKKLLGVWNLHLEAFRREARLEQAKVLIDQFQKQTGSAHIVAGDFNSVSAYRNDLTAEKKAKLEDRGESIQLILEETGLKNVEGKPPYFSMPSWDPIKKIDHILYDDFSLQLKQGGNLRLIASDHLPVWAEFNKR